MKRMILKNTIKPLWASTYLSNGDGGATVFQSFEQWLSAGGDLAPWNFAMSGGVFSVLFCFYCHN